MLRIVNNNGDELMKLHDNGEEEIIDKKLKEDVKKASKNEQKGDE